MRVAALLAVALFSGCGGGSNQTHPIPGDKGPAITVEVQLDSSRLLDVSVLLGADFMGSGGPLDLHP